MTIAPVERPVASAAYSFVRFIGGGLAPFAAGRLVIALNIHVPFFIAAGAVAAGIVVLTSIHRQLAIAERVQAEQVGSDTHGAPAGPAGRVVPVPGVAAARRAGDTTTGVLVAAVDGSPIAGLVTEAAARLASQGRRAVHVVHAREAAVAGEAGVEGEELDAAKALVSKYLDQLTAHRIPAEGQILLHATDHGAAGRMVAEYANEIGATTIVIGAPTHGGLSELIDTSSSKELLRTANSNVLIINPAAPRASSLRPWGKSGPGESRSGEAESGESGSGEPRSGDRAPVAS